MAKAKRKAGPAGARRKTSLEQRVDELVRTVGELQRLVARLADDAAAINRKLDSPKVLRAQITRAQQSLDALVRKAYLDTSDAGSPERLTVRRFGLNSQGGEEGILLAILDEAGIVSRRFVELGSGSNGGNSGIFARELGWSGLMVDADPVRAVECARRFESDRVRVVEAWITAENVDDLLRDQGSSGEIDILSIDLDGNDVWIWDAVTAVDPRIVVIEYNALFGAARSVAIPYDPNFRRPPELRSYFGASLKALRNLGQRKDFRLVAVEPFGANAFFVKEGVAPSIPAIELERAFRPILPDESIYPFMLGRTLDARPRSSLFEEVEQRGLPLTEFS